MTKASNPEITEALKNLVIHKYLQHDNVTTTPSLKGFVKQNESFVLINSNSHDLQRIWRKSFNETATKLKVKTKHEEPDWYALTMKKLQATLQQQQQQNPLTSPQNTNSRYTTPRSSSSSLSSSTTGSAPLTSDQMQAFSEKFAVMDEEQKWEIEEGVYVENKIAVHSFILDVEDKCWNDVFSQRQLNIIKSYKCSPLPVLSEEVCSFFKLFEKKYELDKLWKAARESGPYDPVKEFNVDWAQRSMIDLLTAYRFGVIDRITAANSEKDMIIRIWRVIDTVFDNTGIIVTRNDMACTATAERLNTNRVISGQGLESWLAAWKPDLLLIKDEIEYGCSEHAGYDEAGAGKKKIFEKWLKVPKLLKDMFCRASRKVDNDETYIRKLRIAGFTHNHLRMSLVVMDCPNGYVCRLSRTRDFEIPLSIARINTQLVPILQLILKAKSLVQDSLRLLQYGPDELAENHEKAPEPDLIVHQRSPTKKLYIPTALNPSTTTAQGKKRKAAHDEDKKD
ncbi:hypothetical protein BDC45DRAFT_530353 [Circinella umbellata]|nr:hypothetical protein BDC45DRAFT_530353 [Circinella umbellata]